MRFKKALYIFLLIFLAILLTGCGNKDENKTLKQKASASIQYLDNSLISILNSLNNISLKNYYVATDKVELDSDSSDESSSSTQESNSSGVSNDSKESKDGEGKKTITINNMKSTSILLSKRNDLDWDSIKSEIENLYSIWNSIIIDLYKLGISNEDILRFSDDLDKAVVNVKQENRELCLIYISNLYNTLPTFLTIFSDDGVKTNLQWVKAHILKAYVSASNKDWNTVNSEISLADQSYSAVMSNAEFVNKKSYNTNKTYVSLKELQNAVSLQDEDVFFIKYKNFIEEINLLLI